MPNMQSGTITAIKLNDTTKPSDPPAGENKIYFKSGTMYKVDSTGTETAFSVSAPTLNDYILVREEQASNTNGGTFTALGWQTRTINTEVSDVGGHCSLPGSNVIRLAAGTYRYHVRCPAYTVNNHRTRLYDNTAAAVIANSYSITGVAVHNEILPTVGVFTIAVQSDIIVQHYCATTVNNIGFGVPVAIASVNEIYTVAEFWKIA